MLGQHIQAHARRIGPFHASMAGHLCGHAAIYCLRRGPGIHVHDADPARIMAGPAQPLHGAGNGTRASDLQNPLHVPHVNAQFHG